MLLPDEIAKELSAGVLCRIIKGDRKGRRYCTPRNPGVPSLAEFNPRLEFMSARRLSAVIRARRHGIFAAQAEIVARMTAEELLRFRLDDPISGYGTPDGFEITGGHHRLNEITLRVSADILLPDTPVGILFHV